MSIMDNPIIREKCFFQALQKLDIPIPTKEYQFHHKRKWRFDYAFIDYKMAIEVEGGIWIQGRHTRPQGYINDMEKYNEANLMGWKIIRVAPKDLLKRETIDLIKRGLNIN